MLIPKFSANEYLFTPHLAAHIVYAEVKAFAAHEPIHGRSEDDVQSLTRAIAYRIDKDLHWCDVDELIDQAHHLRTIEAGTAPDVRINAAQTVDNRAYLAGSLLGYMGANIDGMLSGLKARYEVAA